ncbi:MAG: hypothetical protein M2R45_04432 [Verrucomicrobia subdivision 3 bacterium]|nr:hypothetical protein [Limisphaerales bacterium]MCS1413520.1 hypothetical protein [Limisphaerales bacterium]
MQEFIAEALTLINLPFTVLFGFVFLYWGLVVIGALDMDAFDFDLNFDADADAGGGGRFAQALAHFFHVDEGPFMAIFSLLIVFMWMAAMLLNYYFNPSHSWLMAGLLAIPNFVVSVTATKAIVLPVHRLLRRFHRQEESAEVPLLGMICRVITSRVDHVSGQAEIEREGMPIKINARTLEEADVLEKGNSAVIFSEDKEKNIYFIKKLED